MSKDTTIKIRTATENDFLDIYDFVSRCKPLENYAEHFYRIMTRYFGDTCFIAEENGEIIGFVLGFYSQQHERTYFLWQIGICPSQQGRGVGRKVLSGIEEILQERKCKRIELTIDPKNIPSQKLFEKCGYRNISSTEGEVIEVNRNIAVKDYYNIGTHFMLYEKIL